jgi:hypothetical protein
MKAATTIFCMKIRNGDTPIQLPDIVKVGDPITARWANGIRTAVQRLRDRTPVATFGRQMQYVHPFKIIATIEEEEPRIYVSHGVVTYMLWDIDPEPIYNEADVYFSGTAPLLNDPFNTDPPGYFVAATSTEYGVWLKTARSFADATANPDYATEPYSEIQWSGTHTGCEILVSSTSVEKTQTPTYDANFNHVYLGKVAFDENGAATVQQFRKSDIITGIVTWPVGFNIVSSDAGNSITLGSDNGAYYNEPDPP